MNRQERRSTEKKLKKLGLSETSRNLIIKNKHVRQMFDPIPEGTKVMIDVANTEKGNPVRNKWVEENKDKVFTVKYNPKYGDKPIMVELKEDGFWLWCINELTVVS